MSEQTEQTEQRETAAQRRRRERAEAAAAQDGEQGSEQDGEQGPDLNYLATLDESAEDLSDEDQAAFASLTDKQRERIAELREIAEIEGFTLTAEEGEFHDSTTPQRNRKPAQLAMDTVAEKAYGDWIEADRPSTWKRMPVVTYFLNPEDVADRKKLITKTVQPGIITPREYEKDGKTVQPSGVRVRWGKEFTLREDLAQKIGHPEHAGKTVVAWAIVDKRESGRNGSNS